MGSGHVHYINGHLPPLLQEDRKWTKQVLPALVTWAGSLGDPWVIPDQDLMRALWMIIITVNPNFGNLTAIHPGALVFILVPTILLFWLNIQLTLLDRQLGNLVFGTTISAPPPLLTWLISLHQPLITCSLLVFGRHVMSFWMDSLSYIKISIPQSQRMHTDHNLYYNSSPTHNYGLASAAWMS
ncbi:hypothetical protein PISMIDRAFT_124112 [Pisolithus microcarpus 441]|uniref:Uncharacterized protein n=1 Tax=Pisolithus microcarpus 441 TaxID=765257 RepID=A0A0C9YJU9_9AGAM|nr:hypothetical protein PISMIDRAFT_124112 [Pisolithus microcarpus 441]